jgi:hypothetical protein
LLGLTRARARGASVDSIKCDMYARLHRHLGRLADEVEQAMKRSIVETRLDYSRALNVKSRISCVSFEMPITGAKNSSDFH